ncbi:MAG: PKD domain-containing protein [Bacteroidia bacterium]
MKKTFTYLSLVLSFLFMLNSGKSTAQCAANFSYTLNANGNVTFLANCVPANSVTTQYYWNFGNSSTYTATGSPTASITYTANGTYSVNLFFMTVPTCSNAITYTINITNAITPTCNINANFSKTQGSNGLVNFNSTSTGTIGGTTYSWNYGDATAFGSGVSTSHTYSANGTYNVILYANNNFTATCADSVVIAVVVNSYTTPCVVNASYNYTQLSNGQVTFTSTSTGTIAGTYYYWQFGDAGAASGISTSHIYANNGTYAATLTAYNNSVTCYSSVTQTIVVNSISVTPCNLLAGFTHTVGSGGNVSFANSSTGTNANSTYYWNFGDGFTSTSQNPTHIYSSAGAYNVLLLVNNQTNPACIDTVMQSVNVTGISCVANSNFSMVPTSTAQVWNAFPASPWNVVAASWSWGDNSTSNTLYTSHTYSASGTYSICLSVTVACGASATTCVNQFIFKTSSPSMQMIQVNIVQPALTPTSIKNAEIETLDWSVYPNPNNGQFELKMTNTTNEPIKIKVYNVIGKLVYEAETANDDVIKKINMDEASNGIYFIKINANNKEYSKKIIVSK